MKIYILDPEVADKLADSGHVLKNFKDINGVSLWEFSYDGDFLDIGALAKENKIIVGNIPQTVYL